MCHHFQEDYRLQTRVARYHNVYGPLGTFEGGRERTYSWVYDQLLAREVVVPMPGRQSTGPDVRATAV